MPHHSAADFLVLHALKVKGFADAVAVAELTALPVGMVDTQLAVACRAGQVEQREARISGWALTTEGQARHVALLAADLDASGPQEVLVKLYRDFTDVDARYRQVCAEWHLRDLDGRYVASLHDDPAYDQSVVAKLHQIDERVQAICAALAGVEDRMAPYGHRLAAALARVDAGDRDAFSRPLARSYDEVWAELRQDLMVTMSVATTPVVA